MEALSAAVLCGGESRRLGRDKAFAKYRGHPLLFHVLDILAGLAEDVFIVSNKAAPYARFGVRLVPDHDPPCGPLGGIAAGLAAARHDLLIVTACDMPFLNPDLLRFLAGLASRAEAVVPLNKGQFEPLAAVYRRSCLEAVERRIAGGDLAAFSFYPDVRVRKVAEDEWRSVDPEGRSFINVNSAKDLISLGKEGGGRS